MEQKNLPSPLAPDAENGPSLLSEDVAADSSPWYALRLLTVRQMEIAEMLKGRGLEVFVPMEYVDVEDRKNHVKHVLRPVVRNLLFVRKTLGQKAFRNLIASLPYKVSVLRKSVGSLAYYEIPAREMLEFQAMCNPDILMKKYLSEQQAKLKAGTPVLVTHGPLKGLRGKLVRSNKHYFLLKEIPGMAVMLKVTRWCCKAMDNS